MEAICQSVDSQLAALGKCAVGISEGSSAADAGPEKARAAEHDQRAVDGEDAGARRARQEPERDRADRREHMASDEDPAAIEAIGGVPRREREGDHREELREPDVPQRDRAVGERVDLEAHRHGLHLQGDRREGAAGSEEAEVAGAKGGEGRDGEGRGVLYWVHERADRRCTGRSLQPCARVGEDITCFSTA